MSSSPTSDKRHFLSFKVPQSEKVYQRKLWIMAAAYRELPWSLLSFIPENEEAPLPYPSEGM